MGRECHVGFEMKAKRQIHILFIQDLFHVDVVEPVQTCNTLLCLCIVDTRSVFEWKSQDAQSVFADV